MKLLYVAAPFNIKTHCSTLLSTISTAAIFHSARSVTWRKYLAEGPPQMVPLKEQFSGRYIKYGTWNVQRRKAFWLSEKAPSLRGSLYTSYILVGPDGPLERKEVGRKKPVSGGIEKPLSLTSKILQKCFLNENNVNCGNTHLNSMAGKPVVASPNVGCFLRLKFNEDPFI